MTAVVVRLPDLVVARIADRGLRTRDAFATALEVPADVEHFGARIRTRAVELSAGARPKDAVRYRWRRRSLAITAIVVPAAIALARRPQPAGRPAGRRSP